MKQRTGGEGGLKTEKIKVLREKKGWSRAELAKKLEVDRTYIYKIENGQSKPSVKLLTKIADLFGVSLKYFF